jgi:hypothetical protein
MSDIHIGYSPYDKRKKMVNVQIYFHVPNGKSNNSYPGLTEFLDNAGNPIPVSSAPGVTAQELTDLKSGNLCEVQISRLFDLAKGVNAIKTAAQDIWQGIADEKQAELDKEYPLYGTTLSKAV